MTQFSTLLLYLLYILILLENMQRQVVLDKRTGVGIDWYDIDWLGQAFMQAGDVDAVCSETIGESFPTWSEIHLNVE